ncbi:hypothetical protein CFP56_024676 [Quercus suber]|uniref:RNase H type-1 domain-containing protein n=1 Tax=Quercus suber TaxID=58331 RepID=A0AAW0K5U7_QUESU
MACLQLEFKIWHPSDIIKLIKLLLTPTVANPNNITVLSSPLHHPVELGLWAVHRKEGKTQHSGRRQAKGKKGWGLNQETGNFPVERNGDVSLTDVTTDGDRNFWEMNFQIQIQSQGNKEDTGKQENVGSHDRKEKEGWRESYVIEDYERSMDSNYWDPQVAKRAEQQRECHEVTSPIKIRNGPNEEAETIKDKEKAQVKKGRLKKLARQQQNNEEAMDTITRDWKPSPEGFSLINVDGAIPAEDGHSGIGIVIWDWESQIVAAISMPLYGKFAVEETEAVAMEKGAILAFDLGLENVILEGDSLQTIQAIIKKDYREFTCNSHTA